MPPGTPDSCIVRIVECVCGHVDMRTELAIRFDYGVTIPWVSRRDSRTLTAVAGPHLLDLPHPADVRGENMHSAARFKLNKGETHALRAEPMANPSSRCPMSIDAFIALDETEKYWAALGRASASVKGKWRKAVMRSLLTLEGPFLRPHRRHRGGGHHLAAGKDRRHPQLGLPLLLAARRHLHPAGLSQCRLYRGSRGSGSTG